VPYQLAGLLVFTAVALAVVISMLAVYITIVDQGADRSLRWRDRLPARYGRHPRIVAVQALCVVLALLAAGVLASLAPR